MHAAGLGIDEFGQRLGIGGAQFGQLPPIQNALGQFNAFVGKIIQRAGIGAPGAGCGFLAAGQAHLAEENIAQLLGRADVEGLARQFVDLLFHGLLLAAEFGRKLCQNRAINRDAGIFHFQQHRHQRAFQRFIDCHFMHHLQFVPEQDAKDAA